MARTALAAAVSVLRLINLRAVRRHTLRALLASLSLGGGVAIVVAVMIETSSVRSAIDDVGYRIAGPAPLRIVGAVMMVCYVAVPARLIGVRTTHSRRDKLTMTAVGGAIGAIVCTPPYVLGRVGLLMLGSHTFFILGVIVLATGLTLEAGATSAVKAVKFSAKLVGHPGEVTEPVPG